MANPMIENKKKINSLFLIRNNPQNPGINSKEVNGSLAIQMPIIAKIVG